MKRMYCKSCGKIVGYKNPTNKYHYGIQEWKFTYTHCSYKKVLENPKAKEEKYKYTNRLICDYCNKEAN